MYTVTPPKAGSSITSINVVHACGHEKTYGTSDPGLAHSTGRRKQKDRCVDCLLKRDPNRLAGKRAEVVVTDELTPAAKAQLENDLREAIFKSTGFIVDWDSKGNHKLTVERRCGHRETLTYTGSAGYGSAKQDAPRLRNQECTTCCMKVERKPLVDLDPSWMTALLDMKEKALSSGSLAAEMLYIMSEKTRKQLERELDDMSVIKDDGSPNYLKFYGVECRSLPNIEDGKVFLLSGQPLSGPTSLHQIPMPAAKDEDKLFGWSFGLYDRLPLVGTLSKRTTASSTQKSPEKPTMSKNRRVVSTTNIHGTWKDIQVDTQPVFLGTGVAHSVRTVRIVFPGGVLETEVIAQTTMSDLEVRKRTAEMFSLPYYETKRTNLEKDRSELVEAYGFDHANRVLDVYFTNGNSYRYFGVPLEVVFEFLASASLGVFYNERIKGHYDSNRLN